jgi:hypothetical protein
VRPGSRASPGALPVRRASRGLASPSSCWYRRIAPCGFRWAYARGGTGGPSTHDLALELLSYARHRLRCDPVYGVWDAWYPSLAWLKRMPDYARHFVCRLKKNRRCHARPLRIDRCHPYGAARGGLSGGLKVPGVRHGKTDYAAQRLTRAAAAVRQCSRVHSHIGEPISVCQEQLGLRGSQAPSERIQLHHVTWCGAAFGVLECERQARQLSIDNLKRQFSFRGRTLALPALERLRSAA